MSVKFKGGGKPVSDDHQYTTVMWALTDGASAPFSHYFDREHMYGMKLDRAGHDRMRAMAAIHIAPHLGSNVYVERIERTLYWGSSTMETADTLANALDIRIISMRNDLRPDHEGWEKLLEEHGPEGFASLEALQAAFPEQLAKEGERIGAQLQSWGSSYQEGKRLGSCRRGDGMYHTGSGLIITSLAPLLASAIAHLTGVWPERVLNPGDGFKLTFTGEKLTAVEQLSIELSVGRDSVFKAE